MLSIAKVSLRALKYSAEVKRTKMFPNAPSSAEPRNAAAEQRAEQSVISPANRPSIVFDLDETLVFSQPICPKSGSFWVRVGRMKVFVRERPGLQRFIERVRELFEVYFFTASKAEYANQIIDHIAPWADHLHRLFRDSCVERQGYSVKDLEKIGRPLSRTVLIDDIDGSGILQPLNLVRVSPWMGEDGDRVLLDELLPALERFSAESDIPKAIPSVLRQLGYVSLFASRCPLVCV